jgi:hypothetical protein
MQMVYYKTSIQFSLAHFLLITLGVVERNKTMFTYRIGDSYDSFLNLDFTPVFLDETNSLFSNSTLEQAARNVCGDNAECLFDIAVTGKTSIGEATLELFDELEERTNNSHIGKE